MELIKRGGMSMQQLPETYAYTSGTLKSGESTK